MRVDITKAVIGRWHGVLSMLGLEDSQLANKHGPCPMCGGEDRYRFDDKDGRGTWICSQCGAGDGWKLLQAVKGISFKDATELVREALPKAPEVKAVKERDAKTKRDALIRVWKQSKPVEAGDAVHRYLAARGLEATDAIRCAPQMRYYQDGRVVGQHDAMVAVVSDADGKGQSMHVTYLADGTKADVEAPRKMMSPISSVNGCAIRLAPLAGGQLGVAEGIETALSAAKIFGMPVWALANAGCMESFVWPADVTDLVIFADHDANFRGHKAAYTLAHRAAVKGLSVSVEMPGEPGKDWNDVLREGAMSNGSGAS